MSDELIIKESNLNLAKIGSLFKSAFIDSELDPEVELIVIKDYPEILIDLDKDRSCIRFTSRFRIKCGFDELTILKAINNANLGKIMIRYFLDNTDPKNPSFIADYYLNFKGGVTAHQIIDSYKKMISITKIAIYEDDLTKFFDE